MGFEGIAKIMTSESIGRAGLAGRYANALFELADAAKQLDAVAADLTQLRSMIAASADLRGLIASPVIARADQSKAMLAICDAAKFGALTRNFIGVVADKRRLRALPNMIAAFLGELARRRGETSAEVVSAVPLSPAQIDQIGETLRGIVGRKIAIDARVDQEILGGLIVKVGSRMFDSSVRTKLQRLQLAMKGVG